MGEGASAERVAGAEAGAEEGGELLKVEDADGLGLAVFGEDEVVPGEAGEGVAGSIPDEDGDDDEIGGGAEDGDVVLILGEQRHGGEKREQGAEHG